MIDFLTGRTTIYSMNTDLIEKYDKIVRKKYPAAEIRKINETKIIWISGERIASLDLHRGTPVFTLDK
jgi:hypothetical protein